MGEAFTGMDNGEQDGRYTAYSGQMLRGAAATRVDHLMHFTEHFDRLGDDLGNRLQSLNSLYFPHHFAHTGFYTMLGAETAQALPNSQLFYAFLRGAGKQYGTKWWGNASVWNRWGYKICNATDACTTSGTSLALLKRLMYTQLMYNCDVFGFEAFLTTATNDLTPLGKMQKAGKDLLHAQGDDIGGMVTSVAVVTDFFSGFTPPRHLYTDNIYRVWASDLAYETGDYWLDAIFGLFYPTYREASYFHNERGFLSPTPYGDVVDVLLSDAPTWLLQRYPLVIVGVAPTTELAETAAKFSRFVKTGGNLIATYDTAKALSPFLGVVAQSNCTDVASGARVSVTLSNGTSAVVIEPYPIRICQLLAPQAIVVARLESPPYLPVAVITRNGNGSALFLASSGVTLSLQAQTPIKSQEDVSLAQPYPMLAHCNLLLDDAVKQQIPFSVGSTVSHVATRRKEGQYLLTVANSELQQQPFKISTGIGAIDSITEMTLNQSEKSSAGYFPTGFENSTLGNNSESMIAGLDVRIFILEISENGLTYLAPESPPLSPFLALPVPPSARLRDTVMSRPSFRQKFDAVVVDWSYLEDRDIATLLSEARWSFMRGIEWIVDFTTGINLYPNLRLCQNSPGQYGHSLAHITAVFAKMGAVLDLTPVVPTKPTVSAHAVLSLHRTPENYYSDAQAQADFVVAFRNLSVAARANGVTMHLRTAQGKPPYSIAAGLQFLNSVGAADVLRLAPSTALLLEEGIRTAPGLSARGLKPENIGLWFVAARETDALTLKLRSAYGSLAKAPQADVEAIRDLVRFAPAARPILDAGLVADRIDSEYFEWSTFTGYGI
eukprot:TRINITY_DN9652_c0_g1_i4.p1 TRINITY_DN9652_c0_g1~~TRINITY_DN9652_c0_g1_i4.p1  ORF type:complete len:835 (-),score=107.68 TRINITY_DN9652_c0_g1_i4:78-2582(-)